MNKKLLLLVMAIPVMGMAQVASPDPVYVALPNAGYVASVSDFQPGTPWDATQLVDGISSADPNNFWCTSYDPMVAYPHWAQIDMLSPQNIDGIYIISRNNAGNSASICTVWTGNNADGSDFTQQGGTIALPYDDVFGKILIRFAATVNCRYYKVEFTDNHSSGVDYTVVNIAEMGAIVKTTVDNTAYDRSNWTIVASDSMSSSSYDPQQLFPAQNVLDFGTGTYWRSQSTAPATDYPHTLVVDMQVQQNINRIYYIPLNQPVAPIQGRAPKEGSIAFSNDGTTFGPETTIDFVTDYVKTYFNLPSVQNCRYFRITITKNKFLFDNPLDTTDASKIVAISEVGANYDATLGINDVSLMDNSLSVQAFPNPSSSEFSLRIVSGSDQAVNIKVFDVSGRLIKTFKNASGTVKFGSDLKAGIYMVEIAQGNTKKTVKLIKS